MTIRIATYNMENLFSRPNAMSDGGDSQAKQQAIEDHALANAISRKETYSDTDKERLLAIIKRYRMHHLNQPSSELVTLNKIRGSLFTRPRSGDIHISANGRNDWTGWFELRRKDVSWLATYNTARVIDAAKPDILILVEIENRITFKYFNDQVLKLNFGWSYPYFMVVDGNDDRGIDVGIASRHPIETIRSHVFDPLPDPGPSTFSRDCPEFDVRLPDDSILVVLANHFKSKRTTGEPQEIRDANDRRRAQAVRANEIARAALARSELVIVGGDLNDTPTSDPIKPIFGGGFADVMRHPDYPQDRPGTYATGTAGNKIDYLLMSPELDKRLQTAGIERRGTYAPNTWTPFDTVKSKKDQASDHHLVWADFDL